MMVTIACPWCEEDMPFPTAELSCEPAFTCPVCATSVELVELPDALDAAA
jgi:hypothetical protein